MSIHPSVIIVPALTTESFWWKQFWALISLHQLFTTQPFPIGPKESSHQAYSMRSHTPWLQARCLGLVLLHSGPWDRDPTIMQYPQAWHLPSSFSCDFGAHTLSLYLFAINGQYNSVLSSIMVTGCPTVGKQLHLYMYGYTLYSQQTPSLTSSCIYPFQAGSETCKGNAYHSTPLTPESPNIPFYAKDI